MKKKICILSMFIVTMIAVMFSLNGREVKAETNSCVTKTNYYLFMSAPSKSWYNEQFTNNQDGIATMITQKSFNLVDHKLEGVTVLDEGVLEVSKTSTDGTKSMSLETFHEIYLKLDNDTYDNKPYTDDDGITEYIRAKVWIDTTDNESIENSTIPQTYEDFLKQVPNNLEKPSFTEPSYNSTSVTFRVSREWEEEDVEGMTGTIFSPAVYYIKYQECSGGVIINHVDADTEEEIKDSYVFDVEVGDSYSYSCPTDISGYTLDNTREVEFTGIVEGPIKHTCYYHKNNGFKVNVHFIDKDTKAKIKASTIAASELSDGSSYEYTCKDDISNYDLETKAKIVGTIDGEDVDLYCNYSKKKMTLTVNYGTDYNCTDAGKIRKSETTDYVWGTEIKHTIPSIDGYEFSELGNVSTKLEPAVKVTKNEFLLTMPAKNTSICLVYIKNSQTGSGWIYLAWIIGLGALVYSINYFMRYYRNNEV